MAGNYGKGFKLYALALEQAQVANVQQSLALSQLHTGLAKCLQAQGNRKDSEAEIAIAQKLEQQAHAKCERGNTLLSFAPIRKPAPGCNQ